MDKQSDYELKVLKIKQSLERGDLEKIAKKGKTSIRTVQKMFECKEFTLLKPAQKKALDAAINFVLERDRKNSITIANLMDV